LYRKRLITRRKNTLPEKSEKFTVKELDPETGFYYYGARYLDPRTSRWISGDPALGDYLPSAPVDEEAKKRNGSLPGQGGVFNLVNLHVYHYAGNNPVKYVDPDGMSNEELIMRIDGGSGGGSKELINKNIRERIVNNALAQKGSSAWDYRTSRGNFGERTNKCNLFVYEMTTSAGASPGLPNGHRKPSPPLANQWADPNYKIPGWEVLPEGSVPEPGDVAAEPHDYGPTVRATGHVAIVTGENETTGTADSNGVHVIETRNWGFRDNNKGFVVFRRWVGIDEN
jgi:RHS repeat-associated protein